MDNNHGVANLVGLSGLPHALGSHDFCYVQIPEVDTTLEI